MTKYPQNKVIGSRVKFYTYGDIRFPETMIGTVAAIFKDGYKIKPSFWPHSSTTFIYRGFNEIIE